MKTKCVIYVRVSTDLQQTQNQISDLRKYALDNNFEVVGKDFIETISGFIADRDARERLNS